MRLLMAVVWISIVASSAAAQTSPSLAVDVTAAGIDDFIDEDFWRRGAL